MNLQVGQSCTALLILTAIIGAGLCLAKDPAPAPPPPTSPEPKGVSCSAQLFVQIDPDRRAKNAVSNQAITDALGAFYRRNPRFRIADLEQLEVPDINGKKVRLRDVATVDVVLSRAK